MGNSRRRWERGCLTMLEMNETNLWWLGFGLSAAACFFARDKEGVEERVNPVRGERDGVCARILTKKKTIKTSDG